MLSNHPILPGIVLRFRPLSGPNAGVEARIFGITQTGAGSSGRVELLFNIKGGSPSGAPLYAKEIVEA
jgi:hypothetical protein